MEEWPQVVTLIITKHHLTLDVSKPKRGTSNNGGDEPVDEQLSARPPVEIQKVKKIKQKKINKLRYAEYYDQQKLLDSLYKDSQNGAIFDKEKHNRFLFGFTQVEWQATQKA